MGIHQGFTVTMTRKEIKMFSMVEPIHFETDREEDWYKIGCIDGLNAADAEPDVAKLWHDASEVPQDKSHILIRYTYMGTMEFKSYHLNYQCDFTWSELVDFHGIEGWAYISDLLSKGDEK